MTHYFMFTTAKEYPDLNVKSFPFTSLATIVAYKLTLVYCYYLICDLKLKAPRSRSAAPYTNDPHLNKFLNLIKGLPVPEDVKTLLNHIAPVLDNQRQNPNTSHHLQVFLSTMIWLLNPNHSIFTNYITYLQHAKVALIQK